VSVSQREEKRAGYTLFAQVTNTAPQDAYTTCDNLNWSMEK